VVGEESPMGSQILCVINLFVNLTLLFIVKVLTSSDNRSQSIISFEGMELEVMDLPSIVQRLEAYSAVLREPIDSLVPEEEDKLVV
jgi:hypothetical protein